MFKHILAPLDMSSLAECVFPHVLALAAAFDARVTLLHVAEPPTRLDGQDSVDPVRWQILHAERESYLDKKVAELRDAGVQAEPLLLEGPAADCILTFVDDDDVDLIAMSSHGHSGLNRWNVSSVAQKIIMHAATSMLLIRAYNPGAESSRGPAATYDRILVPLDGSQRAECVLAVAEQLARAGDESRSAAELPTTTILGHVVHRPQMPRRTRLTDEEHDLFRRVTERNYAAAVDYLEEMQEHLGVPSEIRMVDGEDVTESLHRLAQDEEADLVLLSAHGYSGARKWPYGSVATSFIIYGSAPLLIVQDLGRDEIQPTESELAAREVQGH